MPRLTTPTNSAHYISVTEVMMEVKHHDNNGVEKTDQDSYNMFNYQLTEEEKARLAVMEWNETRNLPKAKNVCLEYPNVCLGFAGMISIALWRAYYYRIYQRKIALRYGKVDMSNYWLDTRLHAQGFCVLCVMWTPIRELFNYMKTGELNSSNKRKKNKENKK